MPSLAAIIERIWVPLDDPGSRLFHVNIAVAVVLGFAFLIVKRPAKGLGQTLRALVGRRRYWWNRSSKTDCQLYLLNSVLKVVLFIPLLDFGFRFSQMTVHGLLKLHGDFVSIEPSIGSLLIFTVATFVFDDFLRFFHHWLMHRVPWLWEFHSAHHSARVLTPITLFRTHPVEAAIATVRNSLSLGVSTGAFLFLFDGHFHVVTFLGVNLFGQLFNLLGATLRHSQIPLSFGIFEHIFISPVQHQFHHARNGKSGYAHGANFGVSLALWDWAIGSLVLRSQMKVAENRVSAFRYGVSGPFEGRILQVLTAPFEAILNSLSKWLQRTSKKLFVWTHERVRAMKTRQTEFSIGIEEKT